MAKESTTSRIPRLDGVSRIPLPGSIRPTVLSSVGGGVGRQTIHTTMQPPITFATKRPNSLGVQRPGASQSGGNPLKRSCSGDHIGNAVSLMTRKTTTVFKKLMGKPEIKQQQNLENLARNLNKETRLEKQNLPPHSLQLKVNETTTAATVEISMTASTPRTLTRSDTFVRSGDSPIDMLGMSRAILAQSTPAPASVLGTGVGKGANTRHVLYTTQSLENTSRTLGIGFDNTVDMSSPTNFGQTMNVNSPLEKQQQQKQTLSRPSLTKTFNQTQVVGRTMCVIASPVQQQSSDTMVLSTTKPTICGGASDTRIIDSADLLSPMTNATYSNPSSMENLIMLEDVSIPSGFDIDTTIQPQTNLDDSCNKTLINATDSPLNNTLVAPDKTNMKLPLNSTMLNTENLVDLTQNMISPGKYMHMLNLTKDYIGTPSRDHDAKNNTQLLYMTQIPAPSTMTPDRNLKVGNGNAETGFTPVHLLSPLVMKGAQSDLVLPTRTPDEDLMGDTMHMDATLMAMGARTDEFFAKAQQQQISGVAMSLQDVNEPNAKQKSRFSFGLDLTESTLDCSIELVDISVSSTALSQPNATTMLGNSLSQSHSSQQLQYQQLKKQSSFDLDESLGILTPDQMKEFLDSNTNNLDLPLNVNHSSNNNKITMHQMRIDQTPSPEELPLDPVEVKTDTADIISSQHQQQQAAFCTMQQRQQNMQQQHLQSSSISTEPVSQHTDTDFSKTDPMTKSNVSKISTSFITSVTSVTSLDTGYQGDGEMSRPASRGAGDHSPSNGPAVRKGGHVSRQPSFNQQQQQMQPIRRQDPMTDSDFFTESDADDIFHRGDRRAQVIDGQLYGPMLQPTQSVFISEDPEDSCMESSGIFTDVENRCDEDLAQMRRQDTQDAMDMSPEADGDCDDSTETVKSNRENKKCQRNSQHESENANVDASATTNTTATALGQGQLSCSQTSSTIQSSVSTDRLSAATLSNRTSYCSVDGSTANVDGKSFSSLEEAFIECSQQTTAGEDMTINVAGSIKRMKSSSSTTTCLSEQQQQQQSTAPPLTSTTVQRVNSTRKHASLTSLTSCNTNGVYGAKSETNTPGNNNQQQSVGVVRSSRSTDGSTTTGETKISLSASGDNSVKSVNVGEKFQLTTCASKTSTYHKINSPKYRSSPSSTNSNTSPPTPTTQAVVRKTHTPNKWDAVMNKIASNKVLMKKNYNDVKSKVSTRVNMSAGAGGGANSAGGGGSGISKSSSSSSPIVRRSPSSVTNSTGPSRSPSVTKVLHAIKSTSSAAMQPTDTGSRGVMNGAAVAGGVQKSLQTKRLVLQGVPTKRGRSYSKDSQKSSQSDLSLTIGSSAGGSGSPKLLAKTPLRAAKKRDVRNLSISPIDLGPPPKTQQTSNGTSTRTKPAVVTLSHKRFTSSVSSSPSPSATTTSTPTSTTPTGVNSSSNNNHKIRGTNSPIVKKHILGSARRIELSAITKTTPLKDHNRIIGSSQSIATTTTPNIKNGSKAETPTELQEITINGLQHHNNNNNNITSRTNSQTPSPILGHHGKKIASSAAAATLHEKKITTKLQASRKLFGGKHQQQQLHQQPHKQHAAEDTAITTTATTPCAEYLNAAELQQLKFLNRHSCNGRLDYEALERHLQQTEVLKKQQDKSVEALGVLLQYLVHDLDAFGCPVAKSETAKLKDKLCKTQNLLDEVKEQICDKEAYFVNREEELQALHRCELEKLQLQTQNQITAFETQLTAKNDENKRTFECYRLEMDNKFAQKVQHLAASEERERELKERLQAQELAVKELQERLLSTNQDYAARLQAADERENALNERVKLLTQELETLRAAKVNSERELRDKLNLSHDEIAVLRTSHKSFNESIERNSMERSSTDRSGIGGGNSPRNSSSSSSAASIELTRLQSEVESLRYVLEMKQKEISKLAKQNEEVMRDADERVALQGKISVLESSKEMLQSELNIKTEKEKDYQLKIDNFQKAYTHEAQKCTKLTYNIEALQWQLKQRSEQLHIVQAKMQEFSAQDTSALNITMNQPNTSSLSSLNRSSMLNGSAMAGGAGCAGNSSSQMEDVSPPTSPVIKGVIEKPDSVSWVLEMDDETPEVAASKMVKRAGSFRSVERSPSTRRQLSVSATMSNGNTSANAGGPNPLSQSMSATSVIRQHSSDAVTEFTNRTHARIRSKSVSVKSSDPNAATAASSPTHSHNHSSCSTSKNASRKLARQHSVNATRKQRDQLAPITSARKEPLAASSPYNHDMRPRTSTMCVDVAADIDAACCDDVVPPIEVPLFRRSSSSMTRKLITCDTSALNSGERLEMHSLPTHPSMHDIKMLKKCQQIQESAGEAMVSGTNSEDEACSASSDEIVSSVSTSSATSGSTSSLHHSNKHAHMSLEEVLLFDKINSLNGTPMEVSWSDDAADVFSNGGGPHA